MVSPWCYCVFYFGYRWGKADMKLSFSAYESILNEPELLCRNVLMLRFGRLLGSLMLKIWNVCYASDF